MDSKNNYEKARQKLVNRLRNEGIEDERVLRIISLVPRHLFVEESLRSSAYEDVPLPIGHEQTISQPYIVARMTSILIQEKSLESVLEVGSGCGYQAAVLSHLVKHVYSIERIKALAKQACDTLQALGINNVSIRYGDGYEGWEEHAPYQGILVTAAPREVPRTLLNQLSDDGGRLLLPTGEWEQRLVLIVRQKNIFQKTNLEMVRFVPLLKGVE